MTDRKRKALFWTFKILGILVSCAFPIWAVYERIPIWADEATVGHSIGIGGIVILFVVLIVFRKTVFDFILKRFKLEHAPPLFIWLVLLVIAYLLVFIGEFMGDLITVFWMGFIGCGIGTFLTFISNRFEIGGETNE